MVEVELDGIAIPPNLPHRAGVLAQAVRGRKLHHVAGAVAFIGVTQIVPSVKPSSRCSMAGDSWPLPRLKVAGLPPKVLMMSAPPASAMR